MLRFAAPRTCPSYKNCRHEELPILFSKRYLDARAKAPKDRGLEELCRDLRNELKEDRRDYQD